MLKLHEKFVDAIMDEKGYEYTTVSRMAMVLVVLQSLLGGYCSYLAIHFVKQNLVFTVISGLLSISFVISTTFFLKVSRYADEMAKCSSSAKKKKKKKECSLR